MDISLEAQERNSQGTSESKRLRRIDDLIPGIVYGGKGEPKRICITDKALRKASENESFFSQIINLKVGGASERVVLKELQRHPYRPFFIHADFQRIREDVKLTINIPLHFNNAEACKGVKQQGGILTYDQTEVEVSCLPKDLPAFIEVDLLEVELNQVVHLSDLNLPEGVDIVAMLQDKDGDHDLPVVRVIEPRVEEVEEELEVAEGEEAAEGDKAEGDDSAGKE